MLKSVTILWIIATFLSPVFGQKKPVDPYKSQRNHLPTFVANPRAKTAYDVVHYDLNITCQPAESTIRAVIDIRFAVLEPVSDRFPVDFASLIVDSVFLENRRVQTERDGEILYVQPESALTAGDTLSLQIFYHGRPARGLYFRTNRLGQTIIYTHNEPFDAHYWFPCNDNPSDKALLTMTISVPAEFTTVSNGLLTGDHTDSQNNIRTMRWQESYPIAPYLISLAAGPFEIVTQPFEQDSLRFPLLYYVYRDDITRGRNALAVTGEIMRFYNNEIGAYPFPAEKYAMVEVPLREASAMENQTATTMGDFIMDNPQVIAHELAHQWWGNALTPADFSDIWLNEGFASFYDALFTESKYGRAALGLQMETYKGNMNTDGSLDYPILNPPEPYLFGRAVYLKGAWVLHMLREQLGPDIFRQIAQVYFETYRYANVSTDDFIHLAESVSGVSLQDFFEQWLNRGGMPVITGSWVQGNGMVELNIIQNQPGLAYRFNLEINVQGVSKDTVFNVFVDRMQAAVNFKFSDAIRRILLDPENKILMITNSPLYNFPRSDRFVRIYPNPSHDKINIVYQLDRTIRVGIALYDLRGRKVEDVIDTVKPMGIHHLEWSAEDLASGIYILRLLTEKTDEARKVVLIR